MDLFKVIIFVSLSACCLLCVPIEPGPNSLEHYEFFRFASQKIEEAETQMEGRTVVEHQVYTALCGKSDVPLGQYVVGFDRNYQHEKRARKTFISAIIRPEHVDTGKEAETAAKSLIKEQALRLSDDQIGHAIAFALGGSGGECNLFPQSGQLNNGIWKNKEKLALAFLQGGMVEDGKNKPIKDKAGKFQPTDDRYIELKLSFEYPGDGRQDPFGDPYPAERPSGFCYRFSMFKNKNDKNPEILAGCYTNRSYLKRFAFDNGLGKAYFKDEQAYRGVTISLEALTAFIPV